MAAPGGVVSRPISDLMTLCQHFGIPALFFSGVNQLDVQVVSREQKRDVMVLEGFARLRRHHEHRPAALKPGEFRGEFRAPEAQMMQAATPAGQIAVIGESGSEGSTNLMARESGLDKNTTRTFWRVFRTTSEFRW